MHLKLAYNKGRHSSNQRKNYDPVAEHLLGFRPSEHTL